MRAVDVTALKRAKDIDREVLFAGRFLLVKLHSGSPLITALEQAASSYGVGSRFFKEIVDDIKLGTPVEEALEKAMDSSPSEKFSKILFQISNSLKIGVDVTDSLQAVLQEIAADQLIEIKKYGKKLSSITMFYMLVAVVAPSLGITIVSVILSLIGFPIDMYFYLAVLAGLGIVQFIFLVMFKSIRPNLDL
jgi:pilus assembly protein TadC